MKTRGRNMTVALLIAAWVAATVPAAPARAESGDDSMGAAITIGLLATVLVVYGLVTLRADVDRYTEADVEKAIARAAQAAEESPLVLQAVAAPLGAEAVGAKTEVAGATVGWRVRF